MRLNVKRSHYPKIDKFQLFDLSNNPYELNNLAQNAEYTDLVEQLYNRLCAWQKDVGDPAVTNPVDTVTIQ